MHMYNHFDNFSRTPWLASSPKRVWYRCLYWPSSWS